MVVIGTIVAVVGSGSTFSERDAEFLRGPSRTFAELWGRLPGIASCIASIRIKV